MEQPAVLIWNRLETKPKSENLENVLSAEIRDPLWMLCRQWQFGEFKAEDAAVPTYAQIHHRKTRVSWWKGGQSEYQKLSDDLPIDPLIENSPFALDFSLRLEIGQHWLKMLRQLPESASREQILTAFSESEILQFSLPKIANDQDRYAYADLLSNEAAYQLLQTCVQQRAIDGALLLSFLSDPGISISRNILKKLNRTVDQLGTELLTWVKRVYGYTPERNASWHTAHLEYQFQLCAGESDSTELNLQADQYYGGGLSWHQFDLEKRSAVVDRPTPEVVSDNVTNIPSPVSYIGMPRTRWWEMEDATVNFGNIKTTTTNPARLLFTQFNVVYGNDWFLLPLQVQLGTLVKIDQILVYDNFGFITQIGPTVSDTELFWNYFNFHHQRDDRNTESWFYYPPAAMAVQKGQPVEQIHFVRDEMANMVWGIEDIVPDYLSRGSDGYGKAARRLDFIKELESSPSHEALQNPASLKYQLGNTIAENWIPFVPVRSGEPGGRQIQFQRASMPRIVNGFTPRRVRPQTFILREGYSEQGIRPYYIYEEEVPREGACVKGRWKRARWLNGKICVWYAREKTVGRGEGHSGLKFDFLEDKPAAHSSSEVYDERSEEMPGEITISFKSDLPETWEQFLAPDLADFSESYYPVSFAIGKDSFPAGLGELSIKNITLQFMTGEGLPPMAIQLNIGEERPSFHMVNNGIVDATSGDPQERWDNIIGKSPISTWSLAVPSNDTVWGWFEDGLIEDIALKIYYEAEIDP